MITSYEINGEGESTEGLNITVDWDDGSVEVLSMTIVVIEDGERKELDIYFGEDGVKNLIYCFKSIEALMEVKHGQLQKP